MTINAIERIRSSLRDLLMDRGIIARCELLNRTYEIVRSTNPSPSEKEELHKLLGMQVAVGVFANLLSGTLSSSISPDLIPTPF